MNKVILKGRMTRDAELRYTQSAESKAYTNFSLAVNGFNNRVDFINCIAWNKVAEIVEKHCKKGKEILIEGRIEVDQVDKDGEKRSYTKVVVERVEFCGSKSDGLVASQSETYQVGEEDDELPF